MIAGLTFALSRLRLILLPLLLSGAFAAAAFAQAAAPGALYRLAGRTSGKALPTHAAANASGRVTKLDRASLASLTTLREGAKLGLPLTDALTVNATVNLVTVENGFTRSGGHLDSATPGTFYFSSNGSQVEGFILRPDIQTAFRLETLANGDTVLREAALDSVLCGMLPPFLNDPTKHTEAAAGPNAAIVPPVLNSRPTAVAQLYLDFDGETVKDPAWDGGNTIVAPAPNVTAADINAVFARVKEDYWPFNVNVTTDVTKYNKAPVGKRMRCIITPNDQAAQGAGGVAYLTSFRNAGKGGFTSTIPCWVFNGGVVGIAEAISHELGHTFGLQHDGRRFDDGTVEAYFLGHGTGATSWCPIMGASYYVSVSQWSRGEYLYANNQEDDLGIISGPDNGIGYVPDTNNHDLGAATVLTGTVNGTVGQTGTIAQTAEEDFYSFTTTGGTVKLSALGAPVPNLDIVLEVLNSDGFPIVSSNPTEALGASLTTTLPRGFYYVRVTDTGAGNILTSGYSIYASLGLYTVTGTIPGLNAPFVPNLIFTNPPDASDKLVISNTPGTSTDGGDIYLVTDNLFLDFTVFNAGGLPAPASQTGIYVDGVLRGTVATPELATGETFEQQDYDLGVLPRGRHFIRIQADNGQTIEEASEADNTFNRRVIISLPGQPTIYSDLSTSGQKNALFYYEIEATNQPTNYSADNLPPGLYVKPDTDIITGSPTAAGTFQATIRATNTLGTDEQPLTITIISAVPVAANPGPLQAEVGQTFTYQISAANDPTGYSATGLPPGLVLDRSSGVISGRPTTAGTYPVTFQASNTSGTGTVSTTIEVLVSAPVFTNPSTATGRVGKPFEFQIKANDADAGGYGATGLPDGLTVDANTGIISGTPTKAGTSTVTLTATNANRPVTSTLTLTITEAPPIAAWGLAEAIAVPADLDMADVVALSGGAAHSLALKGDGTVEAWGQNNANQLNVPAGLTDVVAVSAGAYHNLALRRDGTVVAWGSNDQGQSTVPADLNGVVAIAAGTGHSLALKTDGTVVAWGSDAYNQSRPPAGLAGAVGIAAGAFHSVALKGDGTVIGWGLNGSGQLNFPTSLANVKQVAAGSDFSLVLRVDGSVVALGSNVAGQLVLPTGLAGVTEIAAGGQHALAVRQDGTVASWGGNTRGESTPPAVLLNVAKVAAGAFHSLALVQPGPPRALAALPVNALTRLGGTASLLAYGSATGAETYQWTHNGTDVPGATRPYLALSDLTAAQAGTYTFRLTNALGSVTSAPATLAVSAAALPTVNLAATTPQAISGAGIPGAFTVTRTGSTAADLIVSYSLRGTAKNGTDYTLLKGTRKIKAGKSSAKIKITPLGGFFQGKKVVKLTLEPGVTYTVSSTEQKVTILGAQQ